MLRDAHHQAEFVCGRVGPVRRFSTTENDAANDLSAYGQRQADHRHGTEIAPALFPVKSLFQQKFDDRAVGMPAYCHGFFHTLLAQFPSPKVMGLACIAVRRSPHLQRTCSTPDQQNHARVGKVQTVNNFLQYAAQPVCQVHRSGEQVRQA